MVKRKELKNGWVMKWVPHPSDPKQALHVSGEKGCCRVHRSGDKDWTAYLTNPFIPVGVYTGHEEAMTAAEDYDKQNEQARLEL